MPLPGGLSVDGERRRDFRLRPVTGELELMLGESVHDAESHAARVTNVLSQALETVGSLPASVEVVRSLCVGDRQFLMAQLAAHIDDAPVWLTAYCGVCQEPFDVSYHHSALPSKTAGEDYPTTQVDTSLGPLVARVPTGADQERIARAGDAEALEVLLRCIVNAPALDPGFDPRSLTPADVDALEQQVEDMAPEIATELLAECPSCNAENRVPVNLYACLERPVEEIFAEVHIIASHYYWSEYDILQLPRRHRQAYLRLIDLSRGMSQPGDFIQAQ